MAYREVDMWEILEVLRRLHRQESKAAIKRATGRTRKTIRRYLATARALGWDGTAEPTDALAVAIARRLKPVPETPRVGASEALLASQRTQIQQWLFPEDGGRGLRLAKVHTLLRREGVTVPYSSLHRFVVTHLGFQDRRRMTVRVAEVAPGELAEVDFGRLGLVPDPVTGKRRVVHALIVTLVYSRHQYVYTTTSQQIPDLVAGLEDAWEYFGGVPARVVLDNLRAAIAKADRYDPIFARTFDEYARHRGFVIDAAVVRHATGKPHVERNVQYVRENFFRGETWLDAAHVHREAMRWCTETAGTRIHGTTRERPLACFVTERAALQPLDRPRFDPPTWVELFPQTVGILRDLQPLHVAPDAPVFASPTGAPIEPKAFSEHWYDALRALGIRVGGLYCTQDTHVSLALQPVRDAWWGRDAETGVAFATLKVHYARWMPQDERSELRRLTSVDVALFGGDFAKRPREGLPASPKKRANLLKLRVRGGGLEPPRVLPH